MSYLNKDNIFQVASAVYNQVEKSYGINVEGNYLDDIQKVMGKLWDKNKDKATGRNNAKLYDQLNRKTFELVMPQVINNINAGMANKTQNSLFKDKGVDNDYARAQQNYQLPQMTSDARASTNIQMLQEQQMRQVSNTPLSKIEQDPNEAFERLKKDRESEGNYAPALQEQKNIYSSNSYQNRQPTYDNQLPMLPNVQEEIAPDANAERFVNGNPGYRNERQGRVQDVGPTNAPGFFRPPDQFGTADQTGPSLDSFFVGASNLRGGPETGIDTTRDAENKDVEDKFAKLKVQYLQDGKLDRPKDTSNRVEDVIGKWSKGDVGKMTAHLDSQKRMDDIGRVDVESKKLGEMAKDNTRIETFFIDEKKNDTVSELNKRAYDEMIINNQLSNNAYINYALIPPEKINYQTRKYYLTVDSLQRDFQAYPYPTNFQVRFEQPGDQVVVPTGLNDKGVVVYGPAVVYQNVGGRGAKLENVYENIIEFKCLDAQIPLDAFYVGGLPPYKFNGPVIDENKLVPNSFPSYPYGPVWEPDIGIYVDVLDEPYYYLIVDEIDGAYDGTTLASRRALAKLNYDKLYGVTRKFIGLKTTAYEGKIFYPSTMAKLSQMTLQLVTRFNQLLNVGVDKVYIQSITEGDLVVGDRYCPIPAGNHLTKITIIPEDPEYCMKICGSGNVPGDRVLFYSIFPCNPLAFNTKLNENVYINFAGYPNIYFYMVYDGPSGKIEKKIDIRPFLNIGDLIIINNKFVLEISNIDNSGIIVTVTPRTPFDPTITVTAKGFVNLRKQGNNEQDRFSFLAANGLRVGGTLDDPLTFQVLYPFEMVPNYLKSPPWGFYGPYEAFYVYAKKQITYTFEVTQVEQNMEKLDSRVIPRG